jgi:alkylation response protein AidB-like acyl-CoA dehydrogenase
MRFDFTADQVAFRDAVRELLARECPPARVRAAWDGGDDAPLTVWPSLSAMGIIGMTAPERWGGLGLTELDLVLVLEEAGRAGLPEPLIETTAVAIPLLAEVATDANGYAIQDRWLGAAAAGKAVLTVGLRGAPLVVDGRRAHLLLLEHGDELHAVERERVTLTAQPSVDGARKLHRVDWTPSAATRLGAGAAVRAALDDAHDRGAVAAAAQLLGVCRQLLDMTVDYAKVRTQFGKAIGSFQAVKHQLADALVAVELARPCVYRAAYALAHRETDRGVFCAMAKARASDAALQVARTALQCHGAIGYSFEYDLHLWMKRAWTLAAAWGDAAWHRTRIAAAVLDGGARPEALSPPGAAPSDRRAAPSARR